jgi:hypothetical protein
MDLTYLLSPSLPQIQDGIASRLELEDLTALRKVSIGVHGSTQDHLSRNAYNINRKLMRFFEDPNGFRCLQAKTGALITGKWARAFFTDTTMMVDELRLRMENDKGHLLALEDFLVLHGWSKVLAPLPDEQPRSGISTDLYQKEGINNSILSIYIEKTANPIQSILNAPTFNSAALNLISSNRAYALYPQQTFFDKVFYYGPQFWENVDETTDEGLTPIRWVDEASQGDPLRDVLRRIGDKFTWTIELDTTAFNQTDARPRSVLESTTFKLSKHYRDRWSRTTRLFLYQMADSHIIKDAIIVHTYTMWRAPRREYQGISCGKFTPGQISYAQKLEVLRNKWYDVQTAELALGASSRRFDGELVKDLDELWEVLQLSEQHVTAETERVEPDVCNEWFDPWLSRD